LRVGISGGRGEARCVPYGNPLASTQRHPAVRETVWKKRTTEVRYASKDAREKKSARERAHCAHRKGQWSDIAPLSRRLPRCVAIGCIQGSSVSPGTHCIREPSGSACVPHCIDRGRARGNAKKKLGGEVAHNGDGTNVSVWSSFGMLHSAKSGSFCSSSRSTSNG
jgi:hypothetical protein